MLQGPPRGGAQRDCIHCILFGPALLIWAMSLLPDDAAVATGEGGELMVVSHPGSASFEWKPSGKVPLHSPYVCALHDMAQQLYFQGGKKKGKRSDSFPCHPETLGVPLRKPGGIPSHPLTGCLDDSK